jgi:hypothetical protein
MDLADAFLSPRNTAHRQYEALRAYFVEQLPAAEVARRFGYTVGSFHQLAHQFRKDSQRPFFVDNPRPGVKTEDTVREQIVRLRKQNLSIYDISRALKKEDVQRTPAAIALLLKEEGFAKLPRRADEELPETVKPIQADRADVRMLSLEPRTVSTEFGGLFLFLPALVEMEFNRVIGHCDLPGTQMVPAAHAMRSLLALKLQSNRRHTHVMSAVLDEGLALFAGLNVIPKRSFLTECSCRIPKSCYPKLMRRWFDAMARIGLEHGSSFDLDFHTIPFHGEDFLLQKHYVSKRSRRQKGILAFLAQDGERRFFCYANTDVRKEQQHDEILAFARYWKKRTGAYPEELIFDSKLTTQANLNWLNQHDIQFITLRRRGAGKSKGSGLYLREGFGRETWGRMMAFLFIWQFMLSGPLEVSTAYIGFTQYLGHLWPGMTYWQAQGVIVAVGLFTIFLLYRHITHVGILSVALWACMLLAIGAVVVTGALHFDPQVAFDFPPGAFDFSLGFLVGLGAARRIGIFDYLGYFNVCHLGEEVKHPGKNIPRSVLISLVGVALIYLAINLSIIGIMPWREFVPATDPPAPVVSMLMESIHGSGIATIFTMLVLVTILGSVFAILLSYSRIPYAAARDGGFSRSSRDCIRPSTSRTTPCSSWE